jgi:hypothetical protein
LTQGVEEAMGAALDRDIALRALATTTGASVAWGLAHLTGRPQRARTVALAALVGTQLGQTLAVGGRSPSVVGASIGSMAALVGVVQTPGVSQFFGCTPLGPIGWSIAVGSATGATLLVAPLAGRLTPVVRRVWLRLAPPAPAERLDAALLDALRHLPGAPVPESFITRIAAGASPAHVGGSGVDHP